MNIKILKDKLIRLEARAPLFRNLILSSKKTWLRVCSFIKFGDTNGMMFEYYRKGKQIKKKYCSKDTPRIKADMPDIIFMCDDNFAWGA